MTREQRLEMLEEELGRQKERIAKVEAEIEAVRPEQRGKRRILKDFLKHLKDGEERIEASIVRYQKTG
jgi:predicted  nucleic acid-binding Zn-ribbon protein